MDCLNMNLEADAGFYVHGIYFQSYVTRLSSKVPYSSALLVILQNLATPGLPSHADATDWYLECKSRIVSPKTCKYNLV